MPVTRLSTTGCMAIAFALMAPSALVQSRGEHGVGPMIGDPVECLDRPQVQLKVMTAPKDAWSTHSAAIKDHVPQRPVAYRTMLGAMDALISQKHCNRAAIHNASDKWIGDLTPAHTRQVTEVPSGIMAPRKPWVTPGHNCCLTGIPGWSGNTRKAARTWADESKFGIFS